MDWGLLFFETKERSLSRGFSRSKEEDEDSFFLPLSFARGGGWKKTTHWKIFCTAPLPPGVGREKELLRDNCTIWYFFFAGTILGIEA